MKFIDKLKKSIKKNRSYLSVGLDPDLEKIPKHLLKSSDPVFLFNKAIITNTADLVCAFKPQIAFYEGMGIKGLEALKKTIDFISKNYPGLPIILDAKRGDIDSTNLGYVKMAFEWLGVDAITVHPYLGKESLTAFLEQKDKLFFILCKTSNKGAGEFQDLKVNGKQPLYQYVAHKVVKEWNYNKNCGLVVGATYPKELQIAKKIAGDLPFLIPGIGSQGGDLEKTVKAIKGSIFVINSSRSIIYAGHGKDFAQAARAEALKLKDQINHFLQ